MKALLLFATVTCLASIGSAKEVTSINCVYDNQFQTATLEDPASTSAGYCEGFSTQVNICFNGDEKEGVEILKALNADGILGDEYSMRRFRARKSALKYDIYDGPNGEVMHGIAIPRCSALKVSEITVQTTAGEVSEDSKYRCQDTAKDAVILARKASIHSAWESNARTIREENDELTIQVKIESPAEDFSHDLQEQYEVKIKAANCDVISVGKVKQ